MASNAPSAGAGADTATAPLALEMTGIRKIFPGVVALDGVDFDLRPGEVHALLGENGAGKSTLIKIIAGLYRRDGGDMSLFGQPVDFRSPADSIARGIKVVYQELDLVATLSVAENVFLGAMPKTSGRQVDFARMRDETRRLLAELDMDIDPDRLVGNLRVAQQQLVEIARAISRQARILIMDEPTSALSTGEVDTLFRVVQRLRERGVAIVYISHKLDEIYRIADRLTVFRDGRKVVTADVKATVPEQLVTWMVGRELHDLYPKTPANPGAPLLEVKNLSGGGLHDLSFTIRAGEVVGVYGLMGAGINTIGRAIFGDLDRTGTVVVDGAEVPPAKPRAAIEAGMGLLTESRKEDGLVLPLPVRQNMSLASLRQIAPSMWVRAGQETKIAADYVRRLSIKTPSLGQQVRLLSGGNQQKVLMARWMMRDGVKVLLLAEPTRGIDVGSKAEIYRLIDEMAHRGLGILFMSTEIPEILGISDRILVMREGRITAEFSRGEATQAQLVAAAAVHADHDDGPRVDGHDGAPALASAPATGLAEFEEQL